MVTWLAKYFVKSKDDSIIRQEYGILCSCVGIFLNLCLFAGKFIAGTISNSIAIVADAFNNLSDAGSSVITLVGLKLAGQNPIQSIRLDMEESSIYQVLQYRLLYF